MANGPEDWFTVETLNRFGAGIVIGAVSSLYVAYRILKSGLMVFGDKATLLVKVGKLEEALRHKTARLAKVEAQLAEIRSLKKHPPQKPHG